MVKKLRNGQSVLEYLVLIAFIVGALVVFQKYVARAISGRWKAVGDSFAGGKQFDPIRTTQCAYDSVVTHSWYNVVCFDESTSPDCEACVDRSLESLGASCATCISSCTSPMIDFLCNRCAGSTDCLVGQACVGGRCQCAGDCDNNKSVDSAELNNIRNNGGNLAALGACQAAVDLNGDGQLDTNEDQMIEKNVNEGCP